MSALTLFEIVAKAHRHNDESLIWLRLNGMAERIRVYYPDVRVVACEDHCRHAGLTLKIYLGVF
jgi:hypothetical protein